MAIPVPVLVAGFGAVTNLFSSIFGNASKRKAEKKAMKFQIDAANLDREYAWQAREDQRDKFIDSPQYASAMLNANNQSMANIGNPVLAREDAYDPFALVQQQVAQNNLFGG